MEANLEIYKKYIYLQNRLCYKRDNSQFDFPPSALGACAINYMKCTEECGTPRTR